MKMKKGLVLFVLSFMVGLVGCSNNTNETGKEETTVESNEEAQADTTNSEPFTGEYIVDAEYVGSNLDKILLVDARGEEAANKETIKGAITTTWQYLATCEDGQAGDENWGCILEPERLSERLGELGLSKDKEIVLFSSASEGWGEDGRIAWELFAAGYENVKIVNGGITALLEAGIETQKGADAPTSTDVTVDTIDETHVINTTELAETIDDYQIVDVRAEDEYKGEVLYGETKGGHLPGAVHIPFSDLFNADNTLKSNEEITALYEAAGISKEDKIVTYCTAGIRSAYAQLVLEMCGFEDVKNYDESYYRWSAVEDVESEK